MAVSLSSQLSKAHAEQCSIALLQIFQQHINQFAVWLPFLWIPHAENMRILIYRYWCYLRSSLKPFFNWDAVACIVSMRGAHKNACETTDMRMGWNEQICGLIPHWIHTISHWGGGFHWKGYLGRQLSPKKGGHREGKVILLSFDKTMELLMCIKKMKGRVKVVFLFI